MKRLAIITTHPIQYNAPLFRLLSERGVIFIKVFYTWGQSSGEVYDARFGRERTWDIPLLDGYAHVFVENTAKHPDSNRFWGVINPGLNSQLKAENFDAVLMLRWNLWSHLKLMQTTGKQVTLFFRGDSQWLLPANSITGVIKKWVLRFVYRHVDGAFFVGERNRTYFLKCGLQGHQLFAAPHAVDNSRFQTDAEVKEQKALHERKQLGIPDDAIVFVYAGKFYSLKQLDILIEGFRQLKSDRYRLLLYGSGEQESLLKEFAKNDPRIIFQPFKNQSEMPWVYRVGDVFVLSSMHETWGLGVNEAMACQRPVIVSDRCGCVPELVIEGETGFTFQSGNSKHLSEQMKRFVTKDIASLMGKNALQHIQQFSLEAVAEAIEGAVITTKNEREVSKL